MNVRLQFQQTQITKISFFQFMGYLFMAIGEEDDIFLKKLVDVCVVIVRYLCGPDVYQ